MTATLNPIRQRRKLSRRWPFRKSAARRYGATVIDAATCADFRAVETARAISFQPSAVSFIFHPAQQF